jgi:uncharacterized protein YecE (DUF72 family)
MPVSTRSRKRKLDDDDGETKSSHKATSRIQAPTTTSKKQDKEHHRIVCGTSGYSYSHWNNGVFYPRGYSTRQWEYYTSQFHAVELNATFYRWHKPEAWLSWRDKAHKVSSSSSDDNHPFIYAVKAHQYFSHWRQLNVDDSFVAKFEDFVNDCRKLGPHFGPILLQFPSRFQCTETTLDRLRQFGELVRSINQRTSGEEPPLRVALEFRHHSWFDNNVVMSIAKEYDLCICLLHLVNKNPPKWADNMTSGFSPRLEDYPFDNTSWGVYARLHGTSGQYEGSYSNVLLEEFLEKCKPVTPNVFIFFNNTDAGNPPSAVRDAMHICQVSKSS